MRCAVLSLGVLLPGDQNEMAAFYMQLASDQAAGNFLRPQYPMSGTS